jgi:8-oxo-dGTP pyrophosphatase MutT (NUDIX family)
VTSGGLRGAAVAIAVVEGPAGPGVLLTRRAAGLRAHPGQWSLPGGKAEQGESPATAALRELHEELGVLVEQEDVLGLLDDYPTRSGYSITPVVVWLGRDRALTIDEQEVASVHMVDLLDLDVDPVLEPSPDAGRTLISLPVLGTQIYAPTAAMLFQFREVALRGRHTRVAHFDQPHWARH